MKAKHFLLITSLAFVVACTYLGLEGVQEYKEYSKRDAIVLNHISANLNVEANWNIVRNEIYCNRMPLGISLEEIEREIGNATPIMIERTHELYLYYDLYFLNPDIKLRDMSLAFDNEYRLKEKSIWLVLVRLRQFSAHKFSLITDFPFQYLKQITGIVH